MLREEEGEKYLEEAPRLSIYPRLPSNGIRGSDESHFFNRLSCFVSRVFNSCPLRRKVVLKLAPHTSVCERTCRGESIS